MAYRFVDEAPQKGYRFVSEPEPKPVGPDAFDQRIMADGGKGTGLENYLAGIGKKINDARLGITQMFADRGNPERMAEIQAEVDETRKRDAPLMNTWQGQLGGLTGTLGMAAALPVGNTYAAATGLGGLLGAIEPTSGDESRGINTLLGGVGGAAGKYAGDKLAKGITNAYTRSVERAASRQATADVQNATLQAGREAGYVLPPSQGGAGAMGRTMEGFAGKITTAQRASAKNQEITNRLAREALDLPDNAQLTPATLNAFRDQQGKAYQNIAALSDDAARALEGLKQARFEASAQWKYYNRTANPEALAKARELDVVAETLEGALEAEAKRVGKPDLVEELVKARRAIAKSYTVENSLNEATGNVSGRELAKMLDNGKPLSGGLKTAAKFSMAFPKATQNVEMIGSQPGVSPLDFVASGIMGGAGASAFGPAGFLGAAIPMARPLVRESILSRPAQAMMVGPSKYSPGLMSRFANAAAPGIPYVSPGLGAIGLLNLQQ